MEKFTFENDIHLFCLKADSFPTGIWDAHQQLASISKTFGKRNHFGISYLHNNKILYMAAVEITGKDEALPSGYESYTLKKGNYLSFYIKDFAKDPAQIEKAFKTLLNDPGIDPEGCCAECYFPEGTDGINAKDVRCMVRLSD